MENTRMSYDYKFNYDIVMALDEAYAECLKTVRDPNKKKKKYYPHSTLPDVKLLPPPKRVLAPGSYFQYGKCVYTIGNAPEKRSDIVYVYKHFVSETKDKIRFMRYVYRLDQTQDVKSTVKSHLSMCVYNKNTHKAYYIFYRSIKLPHKARRKSVKHIVTLAFKYMSVTTSIQVMHKSAKYLANRFVDRVKDEVLKIVPDAILVIPPEILDKSKPHASFNSKSYELYCAIIQAKVGRRIDWLEDTTYVGAINQIFENHDNLTKAWDYWRLTNEKDEHRLRRNYLYKAATALRKNPSKKTFTKQFMGPYYSKIAHKLLCLGRPRDATKFTSAATSGIWPKSLYHVVAHTVNGQGILPISCIHDLTTPVGYLYHEEVPTKIVDLYAKTTRNLIALHGVEGIPSFGLFKDTLLMAEELGVRVRVNKFQSSRMIRELHDRLTRYINRDKINRKEFQHYPFLPIQCPNRTYDGYEFVQMTNAEDMTNEGAQMNHCVGNSTYITQCIKGQSLVFSMRKNKKSVVTIELYGDYLKVKQQYMYSDKRVTDPLVLKIIKTWNKDLINLHQDDSSTYKSRANMAFIIRHAALLSDKQDYGKVPKALKGIIDDLPSVTDEEIDTKKRQLDLWLEEEHRDTSPHKDVKVKLEEKKEIKDTKDIKDITDCDNGFEMWNYTTAAFGLDPIF